MVSVIIPLYNKAHIVANSIRSVLDQTHQDFELIIVNDGSTDDSIKEVGKFIDKRIRLVNQENKGVSAARNRGMKEAKYDLIAFLDGDDWWDKDFLKIMINLSHKFPEAGLYGGRYVQINRKYEIIKLDRFPPIKEGYFKLHDFLYAIWSSSIIIRKNVFNVSGDFDEDLTHGEDTDMWVRIALKHKVCYTNKVVAYYNIGGNPLTRSVGKMPPISKRFISKIDNYLIYENWNNILLDIKVKGLKKYFKHYPFSKDIQNRIKELPFDIRNREGWLNMRTLPYLTFVESVFTLYPRNIAKNIRNRILFYFNR